jgi:hypothetical protein
MARLSVGIPDLKSGARMMASELAMRLLGKVELKICAGNRTALSPREKSGSSLLLKSAPIEE